MWHGLDSSCALTPQATFGLYQAARKGCEELCPLVLVLAVITEGYWMQFPSPEDGAPSIMVEGALMGTLYWLSARRLHHSGLHLQWGEPDILRSGCDVLAGTPVLWLPGKDWCSPPHVFSCFLLPSQESGSACGFSPWPASWCLQDVVYQEHHLMFLASLSVFKLASFLKRGRRN